MSHIFRFEPYTLIMQVLEVKGGKCRVKYEGPPPIAMGIQAAIKDKFGDIKEVIVVS